MVSGEDVAAVKDRHGPTAAGQRKHLRNRVCNFEELVAAGELRPAGRQVDVELFH